MQYSKIDGCQYADHCLSKNGNCRPDCKIASAMDELRNKPCPVIIAENLTRDGIKKPKYGLQCDACHVSLRYEILANFNECIRDGICLRTRSNALGLAFTKRVLTAQFLKETIAQAKQEIG